MGDATAGRGAGATLVILPTYNEAANVAEVLRRIRAATADVDILVVDDASPDGTAALARAAGAEVGGVEVLRRPDKRGLGSAYREGFRRGLSAGYEIIAEMDADLSHDPAALPDLLAAVEAGADLAIGTRYMPGGSIPDWSWARRAVSRFGNRYTRALLRLDTRDATSGFRAFHRRALEQIDLLGVRADGYGFQIEMVYRTQRNGGTVAEVPIVFRDRTQGASKMSPRILAEAFVLVTGWGVRDRLRRWSR
ncbi:MAG: polyprenol monophosphomannose synthase [Acidimicrobiia bacterium]